MSLFVFILGLLILEDPLLAARAAPVQGNEPGAPSVRSAPPPAATGGAGQVQHEVYRFDALRIDGQLRGPEAMVVQGRAAGARGRVLDLEQSFLGRVYETIEAPALHGGQ